MDDHEDVPPAATENRDGRKSGSRLRTFFAHFPWYTLASIVVYTAFFGVQRSHGEDVKLEMQDALAFDTDLREDASEIWRYYTYSLIHDNPAHYALNVVCLLVMCTLLEVVHGSLRTFLVCSLAIIHGASGMAWENRLAGERILGVGASGAVYGIVGAHAGDLLINWRRANWRWFRFCAVVLFLLVDVIAWYYDYDDDTSYSGHLAGFLAGLFSPVILAPLAAYRRLLSLCRVKKTSKSTETVTDFALAVTAVSGVVLFLYTFFGALNAFGGI